MNHPTSLLSALIFSSDPHTISRTTRILESHGFEVKRTDNHSAAEQLCRSSRFDLALYDLGCTGWNELLHLRSAPRVVIGLAGPAQLRSALAKGIHFLLQKPFSDDLFTKTIKAAYGTIATDRLRSFRHQVSITPTSCKLFGDSQIKSLEKSRIVNLSQTGLCLETAEMLVQGSVLHVNFRLPGSGALIEMKATVIWAHASGRAGIKITEFICGSESLYNAWLTAMLPSAKEPLWRAGSVMPSRKPMSIPLLPTASHIPQLAAN